MGDAKYRTSLHETEAMLAALERDGAYLLHLALKMTLRERERLLAAALYLTVVFEGFLDTGRFPEPDL